MPGATRTDLELSRTMIEAAKTEKKVMEAKVAKVREVVSKFSKEEIVLVLQHFDLDVEKTIQAFCEDGAKDALDTWSGGKSQSAAAKKKQRQKANKKAAENGHEAPLNGAPARPPPSSLPSSLPPSQPKPQRAPAQPKPNGNAPPPKSQAPPPKSHTPAPPRPSNGPLYAPPDRERTVSTSSVADSASKKKALDKELKLMSRHDANMERVKERFSQETEKAGERLRRAFIEMRDKLALRESELLRELAAVKVDGQRLIAEKEAYGRGLHARAERAPTLSERELDDLRHDVKAFTGDRRLEEDFASALRFSYEPDALSLYIARFGAVTPVKGMEKPHPHSSHSSVAGSLDTDSGLGTHSLSPMSPEKKTTAVDMGNGISMRSESLTDAQLEEINRKLQESLISQGISTNVMGMVSGMSGPMPVRRPAMRGGRGRGEARGRGNRGGGRGKPGPELSIME